MAVFIAIGTQALATGIAVRYRIYKILQHVYSEFIALEHCDIIRHIQINCFPKMC